MRLQRVPTNVELCQLVVLLEHDTQVHHGLLSHPRVDQAKHLDMAPLSQELDKLPRDSRADLAVDQSESLQMLWPWPGQDFPDGSD